MSKIKIVGIILGFVIACGFICGGIILFDSIKNRNVKVEATVININEDDGRYTVEYEYTYKKKTYRSSVEEYESVDVGTKQNIYIRRNNPNTIYQKGDDYMAVGIYMFIGILTLFFIGAGTVFLIIMIVIAIRMYRRINNIQSLTEAAEKRA